MCVCVGGGGGGVCGGGGGGGGGGDMLHVKLPYMFLMSAVIEILPPVNQVGLIPGNCQCFFFFFFFYFFTR